MNLTCPLPRHKSWHLLISLVLLAGCSRDADLGGSIVPGGDGAVSFRSGLLATIEYEVEVFTRVFPAAPLTDLIDQITAEPLVGRCKVSMSIDKHGGVIQDIRHLDPSISWPVPHQQLPNDIPTPKRTIYKDGEVTMYSGAGDVLYQTPVGPMHAVELADAIKNVKDGHPTGVINEAVLLMQSQNFKGGLDSLLANAQGMGLTVTDMGTDVKSVRVPAQTPGLNPHTGDLVMLLDKGKNLMLASQLYNADGSTAMTMVMVYDQGPVPTLRLIRQEVPDVLPSGAQAVVQTTSTFTGFNLTIH